MGGIINAIFVQPWPFWAGGVLIGLLVPLLYYYKNAALGVSTGYGNLVKILLRPKHLTWIDKKFSETFSWRVFFIGGIVLGALLSNILSGSPGITLEMGVLTRATDWLFIGYGMYLFIGGIFLGLGARIAGGCTSGHSIHGVANLHGSSIIVTVLFLAAGAITANIIQALLFGGVS